MSHSAHEATKHTAKLRALPSVDRVLAEPALAELLGRLSRGEVTEAVRDAISNARGALISDRSAATDPGELARLAAQSLLPLLEPSLRPVINATGVVIHTNLGRAPVSEAAERAMARTASGYSNLEYDLESGSRGSRAGHLESLLCAVSGAQAGVAVNNNAAALYFALNAFCAGREVIVSRGQAVEIGGGFRIPDVLRQSGARLVEVGTTNRTRAQDYADAVSQDTAAILRVHSSNFRIVGFTEEPALAELRGVANEAGALLIDDLGSGCLLDTRRFGLSYEPRPQDSAAAGADLVLFSGDKLLGGPQAGLIVGRSESIDQLRRHPLMRALRLDKAAIAGLAATLRHYVIGEAVEAVPVWRMIAADIDELDARARGWRDALGAGEIEDAESPIGGGSLPAETRPTRVLGLAHPHPSEITRLLREHDPPVIARVEHGRLLLDPRTVLPGEDGQVIEALRDVIGAAP
ncbi:MAG: L-seryl-tRNA(Sec) selenium transferase [Chloroflexi bacterium]|nr:L-seryl-tRNA(Sec) selenium transferase [Chloroflexota bacterium]